MKSIRSGALSAEVYGPLSKEAEKTTRCSRERFFAALALALALLSWAPNARGQLSAGSISGTVEDSTGAVVPGAVVIARGTGTRIQQTTHTNAEGFYAFLTLAVGTYELEITQTGFAPFKRTGIPIDVNMKLQENVTLELATVSERVTVSDTAVHVETESSQMGEVLASTQITEVPLNGRAFTDLLGLQPGVIPISTGAQNQIVMAGLTNTPPSGNANPGNQSIDGQKENANGFIVNGSNVEEAINMGVAVLPNLDSISEFRVLTNNFDAEHSNYMGGQIIVVTKSGTNEVHGDGFEFARNTSLDSRPFFSLTTARYDQNQFGGALGGPIKQNKIFWFADYQGTRTTQGVDTGIQSVPSLADRTGNLFDLASTLTGVISTPYLASQLSSTLGYSVVQGEPYYKTGCAASGPNACVFPGAVIPQSAWAGPAKALLPYIPAPDIGSDEFDSASFAQTVRDDKGGVRIDADTSHGKFFGYYAGDNYFLNNPYPQAQGGANVPSGLGGAFNALSNGFAQLFDFGHLKMFSGTAVNEFHFSYMRYANNIGQPTGGVGPRLACQGFVTAVDESSECPGAAPFGPTGIYPLDPTIEGIENVALQNLGITFGVDITNAVQRQNTFQLADNLSKIAGAHTLKVGAEFHFDQVNEVPNATFNGSFQFNGSETGSDFADYLIGVASTYVQADQGGFYPRNKYMGFFGQDTWRLTPTLTLNYGLRWDIISPWYEKYNQLQSLIEGVQSVTYPGAPTGFLVPTDPGVPRTIAPVDYRNFAPRLGIVYAPNFHNSLLKRTFGNEGKTSIRVGFGMFYTAIPGLTAAIMYSIPPYGYNYVSNSVLFAQPFLTTAGTPELPGVVQPFPSHSPAFGATAQHPNTAVDWSRLEPIDGDPAYRTTNTVPYTEQWNLSIERQLQAGTVLSLSYVGNQGHHLLAVTPFNSSNSAECLAMAAAKPGSCGPDNDNQTRPLWPFFGGDSLQSTIENSNYNALEVNLKHNGKRQSFLVGYTWSKSMDDSSSVGEEVLANDLDYTHALSAFDMEQNFVASYRIEIPVDRLFHRASMLTSGWSVTGITRFATGFPVTLQDLNDDSLLGTNPNGVNNNYIDLPDCEPGPLDINHNGRNGLPAFNTALFTRPDEGHLGTCPRRFFYGPGINNWDLTLQKLIPFGESKRLQIRLEAFNAFNHAQFYNNPVTGAPAVNGSIGSPEFGAVENSAAPRLFQLGAKLFF
jgi:Carboxypeptidase regulatory-like domain/TonB dependent receptor